MNRLLLWLLGLFLTLVGICKNPMLLIFPMWIFTSLNKERLRRLVQGVSLRVSFIGFGLFFGMLTEVFAIVNNRHLPPEQRILLSPNPVLDRQGNLLIRVLVAAVALFLEWAVYGLFVLPALKRVLQRA